MPGRVTIRYGGPLLAAALAALAMLAAARAEVMTAPRARLAPDGAAATKPIRMPALVAPPPAAAAQPTRPAALHPGTGGPLAGHGAALACQASVALTRLDHPLLHTARRLASGKPLVIVAIGSSSTGGAGASSAAASYPSRLALELRALFPGRDITVLNRGANGDDTANMMARFPAGVFAAHPQLVLWQIGTNSVLRDQSLTTHSALLRVGLAQLRALDADVVLIDPQYAPKVIAKAETPAMVEQITQAGKDDGIDVFHRFAVMRSWYQVQHRPFGVFVTPDGLHMNDWGYACWAKLLAASIAQAVRPPVAARN